MHVSPFESIIFFTELAPPFILRSIFSITAYCSVAHLAFSREFFPYFVSFEMFYLQIISLLDYSRFRKSDIHSIFTFSTVFLVPSIFPPIYFPLKRFPIFLSSVIYPRIYIFSIRLFLLKSIFPTPFFPYKGLFRYNYFP